MTTDPERARLSVQCPLALLIDVRDAHNVPHDFAGRIVAAVLARRADAGDIELEHLGCLCGQQMTLYEYELAIDIARDAPREPFRIELERARELGQAVERGLELARVGPNAVDGSADGKRLAVPVGDRSAVCGNLDRAQMTIIALGGQKLVVDELQVKHAGLERRRRDPRAA